MENSYDHLELRGGLRASTLVFGSDPRYQQRMSTILAHILASFLQLVMRFAKVYKQCIHVNINIQTPDPYCTVLFASTYAVSLAFFYCFLSYSFTSREKTNFPYAHYFIPFSLIMHYLVPFTYINAVYRIVWFGKGIPHQFLENESEFAFRPKNWRSAG